MKPPVSIGLFVVMILLQTGSLAQDTLRAVGDCYIYQGGAKADNIYGILDPDTLITRKSVFSAEFTRETYLMFDLTGQAGSFSEATVWLFGQVSEAKTVEIYSSDTTWNEKTLTGRNRPPGTYLNSSSLEPGHRYYRWDVTQFVNEARSEGANAISLILKDVAGDVSTKDTKWHSRENPSGNGPVLLLTEGAPPAVYRGTYYIDQVDGNDENSGHFAHEAWKTLANIEQLVLQPGDSLLFKSGCEWTGTLSPKGSGVPGKPVVIGKYGGDLRPMIKGGGLATNTVSLNNQHHIELRDLSISNDADTPAFRRAVYYHASDLGLIAHLVFDNLEIHDVNGLMGDEATKDNGGIFLEITGSSLPTWFDTLVISNCHIHDVNRTGISNKSSWDSRTLTSSENWTPSKNIHIHHNLFERTGANALIVRVAHRPVMEYNRFDRCAILGSGNASFSFNTDSAIWQYNEAGFTVFNEGDNDAGGFDSDYRSRYTIIQYNYSHDNEYGGVLLTGGPGTGTGFNDGTVIRYNVFANNRHHIIRTSGNATNSSIYNNVFYTGPHLQDVIQVFHKSWSGYADGTSYRNNIFYNEGTNASFQLMSSTNNLFSHNVYFGNPFLQRPIDPVLITEDPLLLDPGGDTEGFEAVFQYMITGGSPAIDQGLEIDGSVSTDLAGNAVPHGLTTDIGAFEFVGATGNRPLEGTLDEWFEVYPNPATGNVSVTGKSGSTGTVEILIYDARTTLVKKFLVHPSPGEFRWEGELGELEPGIYLVRLKTGVESAVKKLLIL